MDYDYNEEIKIKEEHKIWKRNCPFLYELLISQALEWPSLTVEWLPINDNNEKSHFKVQKLLVGTHTANNMPNHLMIVKVRLPIPFLNKDINESLRDQVFSKAENRVEILVKINHYGEVNKARHMPQKYNIIATKTVTGELHIFDYFKHPSKPKDYSVIPNIILYGHSKEGFGLSWNTNREGYLVSGSDDFRICLWDVKSITSGVAQSIKNYDFHKGIVEDVAWSSKEENIFGSVGDDKMMMIYDIRTDKPGSCILAHTQEINSIDFNSHNSNLVLTASNDTSIGMWDLRKPSQKLYSFQYHKNDVISVRWNPSIENLFASSGTDRKINVWDVNKIHSTQSYSDGTPTELIFIHGGHTSKVSDISWNTMEKLMLSSVAEDNILQVWEMVNSIYSIEED